MYFLAWKTLPPAALCKEFCKEGNTSIQQECLNIEELSLHHVFDQVHLHVSDNDFYPASHLFSFFSVESHLVYEGFADDFGPLNLASVFKFCLILDNEIKNNPNRNFVVHNAKVKATANAVFLLGAYLIMQREYTVQTVADTCKEVMKLIVAYRDVLPGAQNFFLRVEDCWGGQWRANHCHAKCANLPCSLIDDALDICILVC
jgi:hypothetical protein